MALIAGMPRTGWIRLSQQQGPPPQRWPLLFTDSIVRAAGRNPAGIYTRVASLLVRASFSLESLNQRNDTQSDTGFYAALHLNMNMIRIAGQPRKVRSIIPSSAKLLPGRIHLLMPIFLGDHLVVLNYEEFGHFKKITVLQAQAGTKEALILDRPFANDHHFLHDIACRQFQPDRVQVG